MLTAYHILNYCSLGGVTFIQEIYGVNIVIPLNRSLRCKGGGDTDCVLIVHENKLIINIIFKSH